MPKRSNGSGPPVTAEGHLRRLLAATLGTYRYQWPQVLAIAQVVTARRSVEHEGLLRRVALFTGTFRIDPSHGMPHAMPAEDVLRCLAVEALGKWDAPKHRAVIQHVADTAEREMVAEIARGALRPQAGAPHARPGC